ncbi:MAG: lipase family protein, partial [Planctomycetota bacterium]
LALIASDAYRTILTKDEEFQEPFQALNGQYTTYDGRQDWLNSKGYSVIEGTDHTNAHTRYWGVVKEAGDTLVVMFRGTHFSFSGVTDIAIDVSDSVLTIAGMLSPVGTSYQAISWTLHAGEAYVHAGFYSTYVSVQQSLRSLVQSKFAANSNLKNLWIGGHSLGGGLAHIAAVDFGQDPVSYSGNNSGTTPRPSVYTFAAPLTGDSTFASTYASSVVDSHNFALTYDLVPVIPPLGTGANLETPASFVTVEGHIMLDSPHLVSKRPRPSELLRHDRERQPGSG